MTGIQLVCQFGQPVRGLSPYGDTLLRGLHRHADLNVIPVDYRAAYPSFLYPASNNGLTSQGDLHWANPFSWSRVARMPADIIHIQHWSAPLACYLWPLAAMARKARKRVVITVHNPMPHEALSSVDALEMRLYRSAHILLVHDANGARVLRKRMGVEPADIRVIPLGIDAQRLPPDIAPNDFASLGLDQSRRFICIFGNLRGYKGITILLDAWAKIAKNLPSVDLIVAGRLWTGAKGGLARLVAHRLGTDSYASLLKEKLASPALAKRVHLLEGFLPDNTIDALLRVSDIAVFPYERFSSQSAAACRAAGMGCPVLVSNLGGLPDLAIDDTWIVEPGDVDELALRLFQKLNLNNLRRDLRLAQLLKIAGFSWQQVGSEHAALYREIAKS
jgi:glycosyltransferase involved in cell wall biosynthesis